MTADAPAPSDTGLDACQHWRLLAQADADGELGASEAAHLAAHLATCPGCTSAQATQLALSARIRAEIPYHRAPNALREAIEQRLIPAAPPSLASRPRPLLPLRTFRLPALRTLLPFGSGLAVAACAVLLLGIPRGDDLTGALVAGHIRALQPGHLMDVVSTDQHTVKPWFDGRLDYAPPVKDLKAEGFPLAGARLDYASGRPVAALVYQRRQHVIDLYVWPAGSAARHGPGTAEHSGYNVIRWSQDGMEFWAVSDVSARELDDFARLWKTAPPLPPPG